MNGLEIGICIYSLPIYGKVRGLLLPTTPPNPIKTTLHTPSSHQKHNHHHPNFTQNHNFSFTIINYQSPKITTTDNYKPTTTNHKLIFFIPVIQKHYRQCCTKYNDFTAEKQSTDCSNLFPRRISIQTAIAWQSVQQYISPRQEQP